MGGCGDELSIGVERALDVARGERLGDQVRLVARIQLVAEILYMALDRPRSDAELLGTLLGGKSAGNALQDLALALG